MALPLYTKLLATTTQTSNHNRGVGENESEEWFSINSLYTAA